MQNQLVGKLARVRRLIGQLRDRRLAVWSDSTEQRRKSLAEAKTDCSWVKQSATPSVRKLTAGAIRDSETWWIKTLELTNRFVSLLETVTDRFDQGLKDAETLAAVKQLDKVDAALRQRADRLAAVLDLPGLGKGTPPATLERPDVSAIKSDLQQIVEAFRVLREGMLLDYRRHWRDAHAILHRLNLRLGDPKHNSLWRGGLDVTDADSRWLDAAGQFVESANRSFENLAEPDHDTARYMAGVLLRDAEHALESFDEPESRRQCETIPTTPSIQDRDDARTLLKSERLAYYAAKYAEAKLDRKLTAPEVHEFWTEYGFDVADRETENAADLEGYEIPELVTFGPQLSRARGVFHDKRREPRPNRGGRSIAKRTQID